ncbi:MAG: rRNA maturation RNase YbeY [Elusimicrobiaceae bacterium]|nr:rRNA maturation RNase YbeY [Elusimicrobiaceae bacterium]
MEINFFYQTKLPPYYKKTKLYKAAVSFAIGKNKSKFETINIIIVSPKEILKINKEFLGHNYVTDVITFENPSPVNNKIYADIFVCFEQTKKQALELGKHYRKEFLTVIIHGILHLIGYNDDTLKKRDEMNAIAENIASKFFSKI